MDININIHINPDAKERPQFSRNQIEVLKVLSRKSEEVIIETFAKNGYDLNLSISELLRQTK